MAIISFVACRCSSSGRAPPCQGGGSEFEPRHLLQNKRTAERLSFCFGFRRPPGGSTLRNCTCSGQVNCPCAKVLPYGQNACAAQTRRRPGGPVNRWNIAVLWREFDASTSKMRCSRIFCYQEVRGPHKSGAFVGCDSEFEPRHLLLVGASAISLALTFEKSQSALILLLLLSKPDPLCWAPVWCPSGVFWVPPPAGRLHPSELHMLGASESPLRQGFALRAKRLCGADAPPARRAGKPLKSLPLRGYAPGRILF